MTRDGFTLIEVLVALAVAATILALAGVALQEVTAHERRSAGIATEARRVERLRRALARDLSGVVALEDARPLEIVEAWFDGARADGLTLTAMGVGPWARPSAQADGRARAMQRVAYVCEPEGESVTLFRVSGSAEGDDLVAVPLLRGLASFGISSPLPPEEAPSSETRRVAPTLVRFRLAFADGGDHFFTCQAGATHRRVP